MPNEVLWILFMLVDLTVAVTLFRLFGKHGLYAVIVMNIILCNIQVNKLIMLFGLECTLGNILYASIFFSTDVLGEIFGKREAKKGVWLGFCCLIFATFVFQISLWFKPLQFKESLEFDSGLKTVFQFFWRITLASISAYIISQFHDVWAFHFWKAKTQGRKLWFRNNASTLVSQLIDSMIFCSIAFLGTYPFDKVLIIFLTTYFLKVIVAAVDTPFIYIARKIYRKAE